VNFSKFAAKRPNDSLKDLKPNQLYYVTEGKGITARSISQITKKVIGC